MPARKTTILIADDDPQVVRLIARNLEMEGYAVQTVADGKAALDQISAHPPDLAIIDVMMPHLDGFTLCQRIRQFTLTPILMLTARTRDDEKLHGFEVGADDYLTKPFSVGELLGRVRAVLRRFQPTPNGEFGGGAPSILILGDLVINDRLRQVTHAGQSVALSPLEYRLLCYLAQHAGRILTHELLLAQVWGDEYINDTHLLQVTINRLRHKLERVAYQDDPEHDHIRTKVGIGYLLAAG